MGKFDGKVVVITGVSDGIGRTMAKDFASEGAKVLGNARRAPKLEELKQEIEDKGGVFVGVPGDVTKEEDCDKLIDTAMEQFGRIDVLVNCAGTHDRCHPAHVTTNERWDFNLALNLTAPFYTIRKTLNYMLEKGGVNIVNIGSVASVRGMIGGASYTAAKHGLVGLTKNVAYFYADQGVRCNMVMPSGVDTFLTSDAIAHEYYPEGIAKSELIAQGMLRKMQPQEIVDVVKWLASDESGCVNGVSIAADGGFVAS